MTIQNTKNLLVALFFVVVAMVIAILLSGQIFNSAVDITVDTIPQGAAFKLDGKDYKTPSKIKNVKKGNHAISFTKGSYLTRKEELSVSDKKKEFLFRLYTQDTSPSTLLDDFWQSAAIKNPLKKLIAQLPYNTKSFIIKYKPIGDKLSFTVTITVKGTAKQNYAKEAALNWIDSQGVDSKQLYILWSSQ